MPLGQSSPRRWIVVSVEWIAASARLESQHRVHFVLPWLVRQDSPLGKHDLIPELKAESYVDEGVQNPCDQSVQHMSSGHSLSPFIVLVSVVRSLDRV
jgi:hypothetical protein